MKKNADRGYEKTEPIKANRRPFAVNPTILKNKANFKISLGAVREGSVSDKAVKLRMARYYSDSGTEGRW
jgi:hypothetical protein